MQVIAVAGHYSMWWVYWIGPGLGAALAVLVLRCGVLGGHRPHEARLCHFGHHDATGQHGARVREWLVDVKRLRFLLVSLSDAC